jgi:hypothetical protein
MSFYHRSQEGALRLPVPLRITGVERLASWAEADFLLGLVPRPAPVAPAWAKLKPSLWAFGDRGLAWSAGEVFYKG